MTNTLTLFAVKHAGSDDAAFCYGMLRSVRGRGVYPPLTLPKDKQERLPSRTPIEGREDVELVSFDVFLEHDAFSLTRIPSL